MRQAAHAVRNEGRPSLSPALVHRASPAAALALILGASACAPPSAPTVAAGPPRAAEDPPPLAAGPAGPRVRWARRLVADESQTSEGMAVDAKGNVALVVTHDDAQETPAGTGVYVALLDGEGRTRWRRPFGVPGVPGRAGIAFDPAGRVVVGSGAWPRKGGPLKFMVGVLDPSGETLWTRDFGGPSETRIAALAVGAGGDVVVAGRYRGGPIDLGDGPMPDEGGYEAFVLALDARGGLRWTKRWGGAGDQLAQAVALDAEGDAIVAGELTGTVDFGRGPLASAGEEDVFVVKLDRAGRCVWARRFGGPRAETAGGVAVDRAGNVAVTGAFQGVADFGGVRLASAGSADAFVVVLDPSGDVRWARGFGDPGVQQGDSVAFDGAGNLVVSGLMEGTVDFGRGPHAMPRADELRRYGVFATKLTGAGAPIWSVAYRDTMEVEGVHAAVDPRTGGAILAGMIRGVHPLAAGGATPHDDVFVVALEP